MFPLYKKKYARIIFLLISDILLHTTMIVLISINENLCNIYNSKIIKKSVDGVTCINKIFFNYYLYDVRR